MLQLMATFDMLFSAPNNAPNAIKHFLAFWGVNLHIDWTMMKDFLKQLKACVGAGSGHFADSQWQ